MFQKGFPQNTGNHITKSELSSTFLSRRAKSGRRRGQNHHRLSHRQQTDGIPEVKKEIRDEVGKSCMLRMLAV